MELKSRTSKEVTACDGKGVKHCVIKQSPMWARPWRTWFGTVQRNKFCSSSQRSSMKSKVTQVKVVWWRDVQSYDSNSGQRTFVRWCHTKVCFSELQWMTHQFLLVEGAYPKARVATSPSNELVVVSVGLDQSAVEKLGYRMVRRVVEELTKIGRFGKNHPMADGRAKKELSKFFDKRKIISRCWRAYCTGF